MPLKHWVRLLEYTAYHYLCFKNNMLQSVVNCFFEGAACGIHRNKAMQDFATLSGLMVAGMRGFGAGAPRRVTSTRKTFVAVEAMHRLDAMVVPTADCREIDP